MSWELAAAVGVYLMAPFATLNPILYAYIHDWRRSREGRALMTLFVCFAFLVDLSVVFDVFPNFPAREVITAAVILGLVIASARFAAILVHELWSQRKRSRSDY